MTGFTAMDLINAIYMLSNHTERSVFDRLTSHPRHRRPGGKISLF
jgi:hypothetical protein